MVHLESAGWCFFRKNIGLKNFIMKLKGLETAVNVTNEMNVLDREIFCGFTDQYFYICSFLKSNEIIFSVALLHFKKTFVPQILLKFLKLAIYFPLNLLLFIKCSLFLLFRFSNVLYLEENML